MTYMGDYLETGIEIGEEFVVLLTPQGVGLLRDKPPKPITGKGIQCISTALDPLGFDFHNSSPWLPRTRKSTSPVQIMSSTQTTKSC